MEGAMLSYRPLYRRLVYAALVAACLTVVPARADITNRDEALKALANADAGSRREAVAELGKVGMPGDAPALLQALHDDDSDVRTLAEFAVWQVWLRSGDPDIDALLRRGMQDMNKGKMAAALEAFTQVIERRPDFAEGWNKRATAYFLIGDYDQSLKDCDETLKRNPEHFGALAGCGMIYAQRDDLEHALDYLERALEINPNMQGVEEGLERVRYRLSKSGKHST